MQTHPNLSDVAALIGTWRGEGAGSYPTIDDFGYLEQVTFATDGRPFFGYQQVTTRLDGSPLHHESGYLRGLGDGRIEWVIAQPSGVVEVAPGVIEVVDGEMRLSSVTSTVGLTPTAKRVDAVERVFVLAGDLLRYDLSMAAVGEEMTHHLSATLHRVADES